MKGGPDPCAGDVTLPDAGGGACCIGAAVYGPSRCTCWEAEYDLPQQPTVPDVEPDTMPSPCADCAFRGGSPERTGHGRAAYDADDVAMLGVPGAPTFWCHEGMRVAVRLRHPSGAVVELPERMAYHPGHHASTPGVPYRASGLPGSRCAGQAAVQAAAEARGDGPEEYVAQAERYLDARAAARAATSRPVHTSADL